MELEKQWRRYQTKEGLIYFHNIKTKESMWKVDDNILQIINHPDKPIKKILIENTTWEKVETIKGFYYYYNTVTNTSIWEEPNDLKKINSTIVLPSVVQQKPTSHIDQPKSSTYDKENVTNIQNNGTELTEDDIAFQLEMAAEYEEEDMNTTLVENQSTTSENKVEIKYEPEIFTSLLKEVVNSPFEPWNKVYPKIIEDERFHSVTSSKEKKVIFEKFCKELKEKSSIKKINKDLLRKASQSKDFKWSQFYFKYKANSAFLKVKGKNREPWFKEFSTINSLIKKDENNLKTMLAQMIKDRKVDLNLELEIAKDDFINETLYLSLPKELFNRLYKELQFQHNPILKKEKTQNSLEKEERFISSKRKLEPKNQKELDLPSSKKEKRKTNDMLDILEELFSIKVKDHEIDFNEAIDSISQEPKYLEICDLLDAEQHGSAYNKHISKLFEKRKRIFDSFIERNFQLHSNWADVESMYNEFVNEPDVNRLSKDKALLKRYFEENQKARLEKAKQQFSSYLEATFNAAKNINQNNITLKGLIEHIKNDESYLVLSYFPDVREEIMSQFLKK